MMSMRSIHIDVTFQKASVTGAFLLDREVYFSYSLHKRKRWKAAALIISNLFNKNAWISFHFGVDILFYIKNPRVIILYQEFYTRRRP